MHVQSLETSTKLAIRVITLIALFVDIYRICGFSARFIMIVHLFERSVFSLNLASVNWVYWRAIALTIASQTSRAFAKDRSSRLAANRAN